MQDQIVTELLPEDFEDTLPEGEQAKILMEICMDALARVTSFDQMLLAIQTKEGSIIAGQLSGHGFLSLLHNLAESMILSGCPLPQIMMAFTAGIKSGLGELSETGHA